MNKQSYNGLLEAVANRRSRYHIGNEKIVPYSEIEALIEHSVKHSPSAFNSQSGRVVLLKEDAHHDLWQLLIGVMSEILPPDQFENTKSRIESFDAGYGTILFFEDMSVVEGLQEQFSLYKDNFPIWSQQSSGMLQFIIWTGLSELGLGSSLQHYNELIEKAIKEKLNISESWKLIAQMPFGKPLSQDKEKQFSSIETRVSVI